MKDVAPEPTWNWLSGRGRCDALGRDVGHSPHPLPES